MYECSKCHQKGVFLCHVLPPSPDPVFQRCHTCQINYTVFECPQCRGTAVLKDFTSGYSYGCVCGFTANIVSCNFCTSLLCLPPRANCENAWLECKKCSNRFKYRVCGDCGECNYILSEQQDDGKRCFNEQCKRFEAGGMVGSNPYVQNTGTYPEL